MSEDPAPPAPPRGLRRAAGGVSGFLSGDRTPVWFTIILLMAGALGTYFIAPTVNASFEAQKLRTDFVIKNYYDLRIKMEEFQATYVAASQKLMGGDNLQAEILKLQELVARVGAQNLSMLPMFDRVEGPRAVAQVNSAMNAMLGVLYAHAGGTFDAEADRAKLTADLGRASADLVPPLLELYVRIGEVGRLKPVEKNAELLGSAK